MNILIVTEKFTGGGLETHIHAYYTQLRDENKFVFAVGPFSSKLKFGEGEVHKGFHFNWNASIRDFVEDVEGLVRLIRREKIDVIHVHPFFSIYPAVVASQLTSIPVVCTHHGPASFSFTTNINDTILLYYFYSELVSRVFSVSVTGVEDLKKRMGVREAVFLPNALDTALYKHHKIANNRRWAAISRLDDDSGKIPALKKLFDMLPQIPVETIDIYGDGTRREELEHYVKERSLSGKIKFMGFKSDLFNRLDGGYNGIIGVDRVAVEGLTMGYPVMAVGYGRVCGIFDRNLLLQAKNCNFMASCLPDCNAKQLREQLNKVYAAPQTAYFREYMLEHYDIGKAARIYKESLTDLPSLPHANVVEWFEALKELPTQEDTFYYSSRIFTLMRQYIEYYAVDPKVKSLFLLGAEGSALRNDLTATQDQLRENSAIANERVSSFGDRMDQLLIRLDRATEEEQCAREERAAERIQYKEQLHELKEAAERAEKSSRLQYEEKLLLLQQLAEAEKRATQAESEQRLLQLEKRFQLEREALEHRGRSELKMLEQQHRTQQEAQEQQWRIERTEWEHQLADLHKKLEEREQNAAAERTSMEEERIWNQEKLNSVQKDLVLTQNARGYKWSLALRRFLNQFIRGAWSEKKDFLCWMWSKIIRRDNGSKWLREFDHLERAKRTLGTLTTAGVGGYIQAPTVTPVSSSLFPKQGKQVYIFASVPYYDVGGGQRSAQMAKTFHEMGYQVYYIYGFECSEPVDKSSIYVPALRHCHIDKFSLEEMEGTLQKDALFLFEIPYTKFEPYFVLAHRYHFYTVYEHIDNWDSSLGSMFYDEVIFKRFVEQASLITVTAKLLGEKIWEIASREYTYLPNAVDARLFEPMLPYDCPRDLVKGKKTLLYFGSLWGEWFDWDKILYVANHCNCEINLIGDYNPIQDKLRDMPKNVHFLGLKKQDILPAYLAYSDIALLPFKNCEIGKYVSPLKIFEYIAMNKPVLATPLDDILGYPNVFASDVCAQWAKAVEQTWEIEDASVFVSQNNWYARCNTIVEKMGLVREKVPDISIIILNHNNMNVVFRCVESLLAFNKRYGCEIIVVDNDSSDGSYEKLQNKYEGRIILLKNRKNGCSSGRNLGARVARGEYLFFLDSDQWIVSETYLDTALEIINAQYRVGAVGWNAGWFTPGKYTGPIVDYLPNRGISDPSVLYRTDVAYLATSGMLMKKQLFDAVDGFDEYYDPTCFEDTDISLKIKHAGYELAYCPYMGIMHLPHQTTQSGSSSHTKLMDRNGTYFMEKWAELNPALLEFYQ